jgi:hypothetical protein
MAKEKQVEGINGIFTTTLPGMVLDWYPNVRVSAHQQERRLP